MNIIMFIISMAFPLLIVFGMVILFAKLINNKKTHTSLSNPLVKNIPS